MSELLTIDEEITKYYEDLQYIENFITLNNELLLNNDLNNIKDLLIKNNNQTLNKFTEIYANSKIFINDYSLKNFYFFIGFIIGFFIPWAYIIFLEALDL